MVAERDISGERHDLLVAITRVDSKRWVFRCDCGNEKTLNKYEVRRGRARSCGCAKSALLSAARTRHGKSISRVWSIWRSMRKRCYDKSHPAQARYSSR